MVTWNCDLGNQSVEKVWSNEKHEHYPKSVLCELFYFNADHAGIHIRNLVNTKITSKCTHIYIEHTSSSSRTQQIIAQKVDS